MHMERWRLPYGRKEDRKKKHQSKTGNQEVTEDAAEHEPVRRDTPSDDGNKIKAESENKPLYNDQNQEAKGSKNSHPGLCVLHVMQFSSCHCLCAVQDFLTVCCPEMEANPKTLGVLPTTTIQQLSEQCAARFEQGNPTEAFMWCCYMQLSSARINTSSSTRASSLVLLNFIKVLFINLHQS